MVIVGRITLRWGVGGRLLSGEERGGKQHDHTVIRMGQHYHGWSGDCGARRCSVYAVPHASRSVRNAAGVKANGQENGGCDGERLWTPARARLWLKPMADQGGLCLSGKIYISFLSVDDPDWRVQNANISRSGSPRKFKRDH